MHLQQQAEHDVSWLAIRQPAVMRLLERELGDLRLDHRALQHGLAAVRSGHCDRAMVRSLRDQIAELPVALRRAEEDLVATVIAAVIWAVLDASVRDLGDTLVA